MPETAPTSPTPQNLHAPWRMSYMQTLSAADKVAKDSTPTKSPPPQASSSFFREYFLNPAGDVANHVIVRTGEGGLDASRTESRASGSGNAGVAGGGSSKSSDADAGSVPLPDGRGSAGENLGGMILLNKYPYSNGHLLIALGESRPRLLDYSPRQRAELWRLTDLAVELCERTLMPQGVNVGLNQSTAAGAGVPQHVHVHVVPRWLGDVNFISVVGQVRVIPGALEDMARRYREVWDGMG